jgi:putative membrane protein
MFKRRLLKWIVGIAAIAITMWVMTFLPKTLQLQWEDKWRVVVFVPVFAVVNSVIGSIVRMSTMPVNCLTLGLFGFVVNALMFWIAGSLTGAQTASGAPIGFVVSLIGSLLYTVISAPLSMLIKERK